MPGFIVFLLPRYQPGIPCILILALGGYFMALLYMTRGVLVAWGQQTRAALRGIFVIVTNIALAVLLVTMGGGIEGVALAASCSMAVYFFVLDALIRSSAPDGTRGLRKATLMVLVPFILLLIPGFGLHVALETTAWSFSMKLLVNMIVYYLCALGGIRFVISKVDLLDAVALPGPVTRLISKFGHRKS